MRDAPDGEFPAPISPEILIKGHELNSINLIPELLNDYDDVDFEAIMNDKHVFKSYEKLAKCRQHLVKVFNEEYHSNLCDYGLS